MLYCMGFVCCDVNIRRFLFFARLYFAFDDKKITYLFCGTYRKVFP